LGVGVGQVDIEGVDFFGSGFFGEVVSDGMFSCGIGTKSLIGEIAIAISTISVPQTVVIFISFAELVVAVGFRIEEVVLCEGYSFSFGLGHRSSEIVLSGEVDFGFLSR
jgi:hypothetical protein